MAKPYLKTKKKRKNEIKKKYELYEKITLRVLFLTFPWF